MTSRAVKRARVRASCIREACCSSSSFRDGGLGEPKMRLDNRTSRRRIQVVISCVAIACASLPQAALAQSALDHVQVVGCSSAFEQKVWTALHYLVVMSDRNNALIQCIDRANTQVVPLSTRHEFTAVGPYKPCNSTSPSLRERGQAYLTPQSEASAALTVVM